ncbi:uncharacterized protein Gasu_11530 [Galdieria sulphuraria]|uniref:Uncharacterized protein n=1 Tax=Galdieria sulphuraria TaxID=130081 RepID=M2X5L9_GALSU|nr:uncharacterized protein Gasu_11530 [Galdieria sulphuraria]EME31780.1 hypothetical protein Gasu_11530 [Galdieria sulphuraria]|eukprot:XP_005708300.1 hypothetical protein Gasu_11530 [Galdieria sulphuraria]
MSKSIHNVRFLRVVKKFLFVNTSETSTVIGSCDTQKDDYCPKRSSPLVGFSSKPEETKRFTSFILSCCFPGSY